MRRSNQFAATALSAIRRALARLTDVQVHAARIFEYYDYGARLRGKMLEELCEEFGYLNANYLQLALHEDIFSAYLIGDWLRHYRAYFYYNPLTYLTDEKIDDELDGRELEEVVKQIYYECFPNLSPDQVRNRVFDYYYSREERQQNDFNSLNEQNRLPVAVNVAKLCMEYYHFDMERHKKEMSGKLKEKLKDKNIFITRGTCMEILQNIYDEKEDLLEEIALKTRNQDYINNSTISNKVTKFSRFGQQQPQEDLKEVKRLVLESLWFEFGHAYRISEVQKLINDYFEKFHAFSTEQGDNDLNEIHDTGIDFDWN